jgi:hypothetical protein
MVVVVQDQNNTSCTYSQAISEFIQGQRQPQTFCTTRQQLAQHDNTIQNSKNLIYHRAHIFMPCATFFAARNFFCRKCSFSNPHCQLIMH